jgi:hypothetical protein
MVFTLQCIVYVVVFVTLKLPKVTLVEHNIHFVMPLSAKVGSTTDAGTSVPHLGSANTTTLLSVQTWLAAIKATPSRLR